MSRTTPRGTLSVVALAAVAMLAGCAASGGDAGTSPIPGSSPSGPVLLLGPADCGARTPAAGASPMGAAGQTPSPDPKMGGNVEPDRHAAPELEALLPHAIASAGFRVESFRWEAGSPDTLTSLVGKRPEDMCWAFALPLDLAPLPAGITVHRIVGVSAVQLRAAMLKTSFGVDDPPGEETVGGKQVIVGQMTGSPMMCCSKGPVYLYARDEALFTVLPADAATAATVLAALP